LFFLIFNILLYSAYLDWVAEEPKNRLSTYDFAEGLAITMGIDKEDIPAMINLPKTSEEMQKDRKAAKTATNNAKQAPSPSVVPSPIIGDSCSESKYKFI